jgi:E3 ubiquitin-protein ligase SHPRH
VQEALPEVERHMLVGTWEFDARRERYAADLVAAHAELAPARGKYGYLRRMAADGGAAQQSDCPVCMGRLADERMVSTCGHSVCADCAGQIQRRRAGKYVCPLCCQPGTPALASGMQWLDGSSAGTSIRGSWGTKVTAVIEQVLALPAGDKCLVFSLWDEMLSLITRALDENGVRSRRLQGQQHLDAALASFKTEADVRALLLPLNRGANGLNLVEAQHVFLVEPLVNTAVEAQAVGRVHRVSQTRATTVHRFVVEGTVEEAIYRLRERATAADSADAAPSPSKRARVEEAKDLSWSSLRAIFDSPPPPSASSEDEEAAAAEAGGPVEE